MTKRAVANTDAIPVHIDPEDMTALFDRYSASLRTEEIPAAHFIGVTYPLGVLTTVQILELDPLRDEVVIGINGTGNCAICHSLNSANDTAKGQSVSGAEFPAPFAFKMSGTAPLWAVGLSGSSITIGVLQTRRER